MGQFVAANRETAANRRRPAGRLAHLGAGSLLALMAWATLYVCLAVERPVAAAELRLKRECRAAGSLVTLRDVAEVFAASADESARLGAIELFPAPSPSGERYLRLRELEDLLLLKGVDLSGHHFSGASQVVIRAERPRPKTATVAPRQPALTSASLRLAEQRLEEAVSTALGVGSSQAGAVAWRVEIEPSPEQARWLARPEAVVSATAAPMAASNAGRRMFQITVHTDEESVRFTVEAGVSMPARVAVSADSLPRGALIQEADVEFVCVEADATNQEPAEGFRRLDEVVGKEALRAIPKGKVLTADLLREPLLVRRGDVVTVCARAGGVCVRTMARAREDGSQGELVAVESLSDRTTYYTRVIRPREVEVFARSRQASENPMAQNPATVRR